MPKNPINKTKYAWYNCTEYSSTTQLIDLEIQLASALAPCQVLQATLYKYKVPYCLTRNSIADQMKNDRESTRKTYGAQVRAPVLASLGLKTGGDPFCRNGPK
jgi:hypothetical protein